MTSAPAARVRILHVAQPHDAGVPRVVQEVANAQAAAGWDVNVACPPSAPGYSGLDPSVARWEWDATRQPHRGLAREYRRLKAIIREVDPDVVHFHSAKAGLVGRLVVRRRIPSIFQPHAWSFHAVDRPPVRRATIRWERFAARWTDAFVVLSAGEEDEARRVGVLGPMHRIPNGVSPADYSMPREQARELIDVSVDVPLVVCVGRLTTQKGQDLLLSAWPAVEQSVPRSRLVLVGDGDQEEALRSAASGSVHFAGLADARPWIAAADLMVQPSRWEGMSLVVLEAMAASRSIVASPAAGNAELIGSDAGVIVDPMDQDALAGAIVERLADRPLREGEGAAGLRRVVQQYSKEAMAAGYLELGEQLARAPHRYRKGTRTAWPSRATRVSREH